MFVRLKPSCVTQVMQEKGAKLEPYEMATIDGEERWVALVFLCSQAFLLILDINSG